MPSISTPSSYEQTLVQAGLTTEQASIYEVLIKNGALPAGKIHQKTPYKRGLVYKVLEQLEDIGLIAKKDELGKVAVFEPAHPLKLKELAEKKEEQAKTAQKSLAGVLDTMTSEFNLAIGKPGVQFYEGMEGVKRLAEDTLTATDEILQYLDLDALESKFAKESEYYTKKSINLKIKRRILVRNSPLVQKEDLTSEEGIEYRILNTEQPFNAVTYIYSNKTASITLDPNRLMSVIIEDEIIANMNRILFNLLWEQSMPYQQQPTLIPKSDHA